MSAEEKLIRYCMIDTQSDPENENETPSTKKQFDLAYLLEKELKEIGMCNVETDEHCYVYAKLPSNLDHPAKTVGFIAHMDTAPDFSGRDVRPQIIECFDGNDIRLNDEVIIRMEDFPQMRELAGKRLMTADGTTLLGADDKAGIACIMEAMEYLLAHPEVKHGNISVAFTPDEEIGNGTKYFDVEKFGADFAYTMDGGTVRELSDETFNAASAVVDIKGVSIHPGSAKNHMVNAAKLACEFQSLLPAQMAPEFTEGREGFIHLIGMKGECEKAQLTYIIRDHDAGLLSEKKVLMQKASEYMNAKYGESTVTVTVRDSYHNMKEVIDEHPQVTEIAAKAIRAIGYEPLKEPIRGGTDGAMLSFRGLPCPNLGAGGGNFHGPYEYCVLDELEQASQLILHVVRLVSEEA